MCFSATANFVGSGVLGGLGVATLLQVKHRRELMFASLPILFAAHQFTEGFVWLGLDGILSPRATHDAGALFMLYAQGLLPALIPLSEISVKENSIVYTNSGTNYTSIAVLYIIATCGSLFASENWNMLLFGTANIVILLITMAVKRYAFTSVWCAYAAVASVIVLAYFWRSRLVRPLKYVGKV